MRRFDWVNAVLVILGILLVVIVIASVIVIAFPDTGERAARDFGDSFKAATGVDPQKKATEIFESIGSRAKAGWEYRIKPMPDRIMSIFKNKPKRTVKKEMTPAGRKEFNICVKCHKDYMDRFAFNHIYFNHRMHIGRDISCDKCHETGIQLSGRSHNKPNAVREAVCLDCHKKTGDNKLAECSTCHSPGSIFLAKDKESPKVKQFFSSRKIGSLMPGGFEHGKTEACKNCHDTPEFCNKCHLAFHKKLPNWRQIHGPNILSRKYTIQACQECHRTSWCATKCHPNPGNKAAEGVKDIPIVPLRGL